MARNIDIIFCGNPGVGKSSLATSISGNQFESGIAFGSGLTCELAWNVHPSLPNVRFADTPGLADVELKEQAAEAITKALSDGARLRHEVKIIFVITTEEGRLRPTDMYTIETVMGSIKVPGGARPPQNSYAVIINKCTFLDNPRFVSSGKARIESMLSRPEMNPIPTAAIKFLPLQAELVGKDNAKVIFGGLLEWVMSSGAPAIVVVSAQKIDTASMEEVLERMKQEHDEKIARLNNLTEKQANELAEASKARQEMEDTLRREIRRMQESIERANELAAARKVASWELLWMWEP